MAYIFTGEYIHDYAVALLRLTMDWQQISYPLAADNMFPNHQPLFKQVDAIELELARGLSFPATNLTMSRLAQIEEILVAAYEAYLIAQSDGLRARQETPSHLDALPSYYPHMKQYLETSLFYLMFSFGDKLAGQRVRISALLNILTSHIKGAKLEINSHHVSFFHHEPTLAWHPANILFSRIAANWINDLDEAALAQAFGDPRRGTKRHAALPLLNYIADTRMQMMATQSTTTASAQRDSQAFARHLDAAQGRILSAFMAPSFTLSHADLKNIRAELHASGQHAGVACNWVKAA